MKTFYFIVMSITDTTFSNLRNTNALCGLISSAFILTHFNTVFHFHNPCKRQETFGFLTISGGIEMEHWAKIGYEILFSEKI